MTTFLTLIVNGASLGSIFAMTTLGFVIIFKASEVLNFAHGSMLLAGAYLIARTAPHIGFWGAITVGIAGAALLALAVERGLLSRLRPGLMAAPTVMTIGVDILLVTELTRGAGSAVLSLHQPWGDHSVALFGIAISVNRIIAMAVAVTMIAAFFAASRWTDWGVALRASAEDSETAALMGVRLGRVRAGTWMVAGVLAAVAGIFLTGAPTPGLDPSIRDIALTAFPAAIIGGVDSTGGALAGGFIVGVAQSLAAGYSTELGFLGDGFGTVVPFLVMLLVLIIRPSGLFGSTEATRV